MLVKMLTLMSTTVTVMVPPMEMDVAITMTSMMTTMTLAGAVKAVKAVTVTMTMMTKRVPLMMSRYSPSCCAA
jgi:hypothetical protein